ncbi:GMC family oxidoreductase [Cupriavidus pinatubonensis]|uniref:GMC family oxidoreductase n=1 Tax=Cupriavidus pinatubonensis TaxID=248026 RepID=UPI001126D143|nr:GMC family oxidoreductase N-terminal domain-containing protein [Cupriavidus pinatubonensis]TPQ39766.1 hypothetical protein C2U69_11300 [Cupriavidus pinatubonensis]
MEIKYDYIIVGGGSAGCVLAGRLSENPNCSVLMVEAGNANPPSDEPADIRDIYPLSSYNASYFWPEVKAYWRNRLTSSAVKFPQAQIMGGGSCVAGMVAFRGTADDYQEWEDAGASGWSWDDVLPYFRKLESDQDFDGDAHGSNGPIPIRRVPREQWPPLTLAIEEYARNAGMSFVADMNADFGDGFGVTPISNTELGRVTTASGYLSSAVRKRENLKILSNAFAKTLTFDGRRVTGVVVVAEGETVSYRAEEVIISAGAIHSPAILQRAGIGAAKELQEIRVPVLVNRPGVGKNLQNHAALFVGAILPRRFRQQSSLRTHPTTCMRLSSGFAGTPASDLYINIQSKTSWNAMGTRLASLNAVLLKPEGRGTVSLAGPDPEQEPIVEFGFGEHARDMQRLAEGLRQTFLALRSSYVAPHIGKPFVVRLGDRIRKWNTYTRKNALQAAIFASLLDVMPLPVADRLLARMTGESVDIEALSNDKDAMVEFVRREVAGVYHPVGTCRMGRPDDDNAVVDSEGRVIGVEKLRVVDASIMPSIPRGNTNIPTIMLAEKIADHVLRARYAA